jgi:hypothetical protein
MRWVQPFTSTHVFDYLKLAQFCWKKLASTQLKGETIGYETLLNMLKVGKLR